MGKGKVKYESYDGNETIEMGDCVPIWDAEGNCIGFVQKLKEPSGENPYDLAETVSG